MNTTAVRYCSKILGWKHCHRFK